MRAFAHWDGDKPGIVSVCELPLVATEDYVDTGIIVGATTPEAYFGHQAKQPSLIKLYLVYSDEFVSESARHTWNLTTGKTRVVTPGVVLKQGRWDDYSHPGLVSAERPAVACCYDGAVSTPMPESVLVVLAENEEQAKSFWPNQTEN
ncbi:hypothetical protein SPFM9_00003 [Salmonella phage SPFM9]|nr:hypothetical protein SPFM9_00003 [Salmonella phage SPFM9]